MQTLDPTQQKTQKAQLVKPVSDFYRRVMDEA